VSKVRKFNWICEAKIYPFFSQFLTKSCWLVVLLSVTKRIWKMEKNGNNCWTDEIAFYLEATIGINMNLF